MVMDVIGVARNAPAPMLVKLGGRVMDVSVCILENAELPILSTPAGRFIDDSFVASKVSFPIVLSRLPAISD
jgi:hypothetical protein